MLCSVDVLFLRQNFWLLGDTCGMDNKRRRRGEKERKREREKKKKERKMIEKILATYNNAEDVLILRIEARI